MKARHILIGAGLLLAACTSDDETVSTPSGATLQITTELVSTRAFNTGLKSETEFAAGNEIGLAVFYNGTPYQSDLMNVKATYDGTSWQTEKRITLDERPATILAYYPYSNSSIFNATYSSLIIPIDISSYAHGDGQQDYLRGSATSTVSSTNPVARIKFYHALPRLTFNITKSAEHAGETIKIRSVKLTPAYTKGRMSMFAFSDIPISDIGADYSSAPTDITQVVNATLSASAPTTCEFLVFPGISSSGMRLQIEVMRGESTGSYTTYDVDIPATTWMWGGQYTYPVTIKLGAA